MFIVYARTVIVAALLDNIETQKFAILVSYLGSFVQKMTWKHCTLHFLSLQVESEIWKFCHLSKLLIIGCAKYEVIAMYLMHYTSDEKEDLWNNKELVSKLFCALSLELYNMSIKAKPILFKPLLWRKIFYYSNCAWQCSQTSVLNICYLATLFVVGCTKMP